MAGRAPNRGVAINRILTRIAAGEGDERDRELYARACQGDLAASAALLMRIDPGRKVTNKELGFGGKAKPSLDQ